MAEGIFSSTHPLLPPTTEDDRLSWLRLLRSRRVGVSTFYRLMGEHGSAQAALDALPHVAAAAGVENYQTCPLHVAEQEMVAARALAARLVCRGMDEYPETLAQIADAPPFFWAMGDISVLNRPMIALVGARNASSLGTRMTRALSAGLGEKGYVIVSGMARGVDAVAHLAAIDTGTVAVLGGGVDVIYPADNALLAEDIVKKGGLRISEQPMGLRPQARHFPARNRIISGLAQAVVVVEAAARFGSLITARQALDQGREVLAVPGHPFDARAGGCNLLIRDGARLVRHVDDVIEALPPAEEAQCHSQAKSEPQVPLPERRSLRETAQLHQQILDRLGPSPVAEDQLIRDLGGDAARIPPVLTELELDGRIARQSGGLLALAGASMGASRE